MRLLSLLVLSCLFVLPTSLEASDSSSPPATLTSSYVDVGGVTRTVTTRQQENETFQEHLDRHDSYYEALKDKYPKAPVIGVMQVSTFDSYGTLLDTSPPILIIDQPVPVQGSGH